MKKIMFLKMFTVLVLCLNLAVPPGLLAQGDKGETTKGEGPAFRPEEIDQMVAPIALYPDDLLAQVLVASTYPLEIVQAARLVEQHKDLKGEKLMEAAKDKDWDPSVKAMLQFPDVLAMMNERIEWTQKLGDAFLGQQRDVMDSVQRLRTKAEESGNLKTTKEQKVTVDQRNETIIIQSASPQVVYVPTYDPAVVYGTWPYPAYPPYYYYPPGYAAGAALFSFGVGVAVGAAWGGYHGWGCGWGNSEININNSRYNNFTRNSYNNSQRYQANQNVKNQNWQHNPEHRKGAQYRDPATAEKFGQQRPGAEGRATTSEARGYGRGTGAGGEGRAQTTDLSSRVGAEEGRRTGAGGEGRAQTSDLSRGGSAGQGRGTGAGGEGRAQTSDLSRGGGRETGAGGGGRAQTSDLSRGGSRDNAFSGSDRGGSERASSFRGQESRSSASRSTGSFGGGGASRGGGGFSRGGGGGRGGGGRR